MLTIFYLNFSFEKQNLTVEKNYIYIKNRCMDINDFISKIEAEIDEIEPGSLTPTTNIRNTSAWTSMHALILIALIDTEYNVTISGEDLRNSSSVEDIFKLVQSRI